MLIILIYFSGGYGGSSGGYGGGGEFCFIFLTKFSLKFESFLLGYSKGGYGGYRDASADDTDKAPHKWHFGEPLHLFGQEVKLTTAKKSFTRASDPSH